MKPVTRYVLAILLTLSGAASPSRAQEAAENRPLPPIYATEPFVNIWIERSSNLSRGQIAKVGYSADPNTYVTILKVSTDGDITIVVPKSPAQNARFTGQDTMQTAAFHADAADGVGAIVILGSRSPFDFSRYRGKNGGWLPLPAKASTSPAATVKRFAQRAGGEGRGNIVSLQYADYSVSGKPTDMNGEPAPAAILFDPWSDGVVDPCWDGPRPCGGQVYVVPSPVAASYKRCTDGNVVTVDADCPRPEPHRSGNPHHPGKGKGRNGGPPPHP